MSVKIAIISDLHLGIGRNTERSEDCWDAAREAFEKAKDCDLILLPGDIFDGRIPRPEDWAKCMGILSNVKVPIVAIHGNHERRGKGLINPVEGLEHAKFLKYLHCKSKVFDIKGRKISVFGMGWVPEAYAKEVLHNCNPQPVEGAYNIFVLHQSVSPYVFNSIEPPSLTLEDLPKGFDLYVCGHIHWNVMDKTHGKPFLIPGSTVTTQVNKSEAKNPKGFYIVELDDDVKINFIKLDSARKVYYKEFKVDNNKKISDITEEIEEYLNGINEDKKPLVRVVVRGSIGKGSNLDLRYLKDKYRDKMILSVGVRVSEEELEKKIKLLRDVMDERVSIMDIGMRILRENMNEMKSSFDFEEIFEFLVDGNVDGAMAQLLSNLDEFVNKSKNPSVDMSGLQRWVS
ncbi:MAG: metallophosphoesterase [Candidatus Aenigmarchaeota archaeon]|nr:metallophosphoesterase [Candidatus Aenigmarchaeota archaeon]